LIDEPETPNETSDANPTEISTTNALSQTAETPVPTGPGKETKTNQAAQYRQKIVRLFVAVRNCLHALAVKTANGLKSAVEFVDKYDGAIAALATVAIVVLTYVYVSYSKKQWQEMQNARRPWVGISQNIVVTEPPTFMVGNAAIKGLDGEDKVIVITLKLSGTLQNFGLSPARRVFTTFEIVESEAVIPLLRDAYCDTAVMKSDLKPRHNKFATLIQSSPGPTKAIFPSTSIPIEETVVFGMMGFENKPYKLPDPLWLLGCVAYQGSDDTVKHTKFVYRSVIDTSIPEQAVTTKPTLTAPTIRQFVLNDSDSD
jgi:hypothetical protein